MADNNHRTVGFKGSTHSISYNVRTTKYNTIRTQYDVLRGTRYAIKIKDDHTNAKTRLSNRAGLSFFCGTYCAYQVTSYFLRV